MNPTGPSDTRLKREKISLPKWSIYTLVLFVLVLIVGFNARPLYHAFNDWRAESAAQKLNAQIDQGDREKAMNLGGELFRQFPDSSPVLRALARLLAEVSADYSTAASLVKRIISKEQATDEDRISLAEYLAKAGDLLGAQKAIAALPESVQNTRRVLEARSATASFMGDNELAKELLRSALQADPENPDCQLRLAILEDSESFVISQRSPALDRIWDLAERDDKTGLAAIGYLAASRSLSAVDVPQLLDFVSKHPQAKDEHIYSVLLAHHKLRPLDTERLVQSELERQKGRSVDDLTAFFRWLVAVGHHEDILRLMSLEQVMKDSKSMLVYIDALSAGGEWKTLIDLMNRQRLPISEATRSLVLGQSHGRLDSSQSDRAAQFLRDSIGAAGQKDVVLLTRAAETAESLGLTSVAQEAYRRVLKSQPEKRIVLLERLLALFRRDRDALGTVETLKELILARPGFQPYVDELNYTRLISGVEMELALADMKAERPQSVLLGRSVPLMHAMTSKRFGQSDDWKHHLSQIDDPQALTPGMRAVLAGYLADAGHSDKAYRLAETIIGTFENGRLVGDKRSLLLPEELKLLEMSLR